METTPTAREALIVFAKVPVPGTVKTRLTALLSPEEAAALYEAFLYDALRQYAQLGADVRLYLSPTEATMPAGLVPEGVTVWTQSGAGLGERMSHAFLETFVHGYAAAVIIGTDHPTLPSAFVVEALRQLHEPGAIVIGPSDDGGYYLLGMNAFYPELFEGMTYSHEDVFAQTLERMERTPASSAIMPAWYDVDTPDTLLRLVQELGEAPEGVLPATRAVLTALQGRYPELRGGR